MVDPVTSRRWFYHLLFTGLALLILFFKLLPMTQEVGSWPGPDLILVLAVAWGMRRPDYVPPLLLGAVLLVADLLLQQPPGLHAALVIVALELARTRYAMWRDLPFAGEWGIAAVLIGAVILGDWLVLAVLMVSQAPFGLYMIELIVSIAAYPLVAGVSVWLLGVTKPAPGSAEALGQGQ